MSKNTGCTNISPGPVSFRRSFKDLLRMKSVCSAIDESVFMARTVIGYHRCIWKIVAFSKKDKKLFVIFFWKRWSNRSNPADINLLRINDRNTCSKLKNKDTRTSMGHLEYLSIFNLDSDLICRAVCLQLQIEL